MHHELKILEPFFEAVIRGQKKFEIRSNVDRGFQKGDTVLLKEIKRGTCADIYTKREQMIEITYVSDYNQPSNQVVFAFSLLGESIGT